MAGQVHHIRFEPSGLNITVDSGETILDASLRQGISIAYGCRQGNCSTCKYFLIDGDVDFGKASPYSLSEQEREEGWALLCCAKPLTDLEVQDKETADERLLTLITPTKQLAKVTRVEPLTTTLWSLQLELAEPLEFYPGQFVELGVPKQQGEWRSYSIASTPSKQDHLELVVKQIPARAFSGIINSLKPGVPIPIRGPFGTGYLRESSGPVLLVAIGSGIAPLLSMLRSAAESEDLRSFSLFYGARTRADLPHLKEIEYLQERLTSFTFIPSLSAPTETCKWEGITGRVTQTIQRVPNCKCNNSILTSP